MFRALLVFSCFLVASSLISCAYNKEELPGPEETAVDPVITYTSHVKTIIDNNCVSCHSSGSVNQPPFLTDYSQVKSQASNGRILARVINGSPSFMPPAGSLPQPMLDTLQLWLNQGSLQ